MWASWQLSHSIYKKLASLLYYLAVNKVTLGQFVTSYTRVFDAMPVVLTTFKHALTFRASIAMCKNSFSTLK